MKSLVVVVMAVALAACDAEPDAARTPAESNLVETGVPEGRAFAGSSSVIVADESQLASVDPKSREVRWRAEFGATGAVLAFGSLWASDFTRSTVRRIDESNGEMTTEVYVDGNPMGIAATDEWVWTANHRGGSVSRIDPSTNEVDLTTRVGPEGRSGPMRLAADDEHVYVDVNNNRTVVQLDARTGEVTGKVRFPGGFIPCGELTVDPPYVWVTACHESDQVARIDFRQSEVLVSDPLSFHAGDGIVRDGVVWFAGTSVTDAAGAFVAVDRRTLRVLGSVRQDGNEKVAAAFGRLWVAGPEGLGSYDPSSLTVPGS